MPVAAPDLVRPAWHTCPPYTVTDGPLVGEVARLVGFDPDPEQQLVLDDLFGLHGDRAVALETAVICARQNLKTAVAQMACLGWMFVTGQRLIVWSAHQFATAQEAFRDLDELCAAHPSLSGRVARVWRGNGDEAIELKSGARVIFRARTKGGGRGLSGDKVVLDEAFALHPMHMGALLPTLSARPDPQVLYASSAGLADSDVLRSIRDRGRAGDPSLAYLEWGDPNPHEGCAAEDCDHALSREGCVLDDESRWRCANPAMGRRIEADYIAAERRALPPEEFARERLGWWDEPGAVHAELTVQAWDALAGDVAPKDPLVLWLDVAPGHAWASVGVTDGTDCELIDRRVGAGWLVERVAELQVRHSCRAVAFDGASSAPVAALMPDLLAAGLPLVPVAGGDWARACQAMVRLVKQAAFRHDGSPEFAAAVAGARWRVVGDGLKLSRRDSTVDITPLAGLTAGLWVATSEPAPSEGFALVIPTT